jgi:hypothetical protein
MCDVYVKCDMLFAFATIQNPLCCYDGSIADLVSNRRGSTRMMPSWEIEDEMPGTLGSEYSEIPKTWLSSVR